MKPVYRKYCTLLVCLWAGTLQARVDVVLPEGPLPADQPFTVEYEVESASRLSPPDLSPLENSFYVLNRAASSSSVTSNGQYRETLTINLLLQPRQSGTLTVPALRFGNQSSEPRTIVIQEGSQTPPERPGSAPPAWMPPPPTWVQPGGDSPEQVTTEKQPEITSPSPAETKKPETGIWPWLTVFSLLGWALTGWWGWQRGRPPAPAESIAKAEIASEPAPAAEPAQTDINQLADALPAIEKAFLAADAYAAKKALLHWAKLRWPDNPPGNLSRLAARCDSRVQTQILKLEAAQYTPNGNSDWHQRPIWEQLPMPEKEQASS